MGKPPELRETPLDDDQRLRERREHDEPEEMGASPSRISTPELRFEAKRAFVWVAVIGAVALAIYIAESLLVIFGALVFAAIIDGGARLLGRVLPLPRTVRVLIVLLLTIAFFAWLFYFAGTTISAEAAQLPSIVGLQIGRAIGWLRSQGFEVNVDQIQGLIGTVTSGMGTVTSAIGGVLGGLTTVVLIGVIGIYLAIEPKLYERGVEWLAPRESRSALSVTLSRMAHTMRRLMAGRLLGMVIEGVFTWALLAIYGVPMAVLLGILTGLLAFIPNLGALIAGVLMAAVGFSGGVDMGLYTLGVYAAVQMFDGYVIIPLIAKKTVDLAPALVLGAQLIMGILFGILGLFLADPLMAMIKVALERRAESQEDDEAAAGAEAGASSS